MHFIAVAMAGTATLILSAMPSLAHEHAKVSRLGAPEQAILVAGTEGSRAGTPQPDARQPAVDDTKTEPAVRRTESGIRIVGAPFLPEK